MDPKRLDAIPLFALLSKKERKEVARHADEVDVAEGKALVNEGDFAYEFFVIEEGTAAVNRGGEHVADLGPGDFFGEMGAIESAKRNASVIATSPIRAVVMTAREFRQMSRTMPAICQRIEAAIQERSETLMDGDSVAA